jgi:hypothetical protein
VGCELEGSGQLGMGWDGIDCRQTLVSRDLRGETWKAWQRVVPGWRMDPESWVLGLGCFDFGCALFETLCRK